MSQLSYIVCLKTRTCMIEVQVQGFDNDFEFESKTLKQFDMNFQVGEGYYRMLTF